MELPGGSSPIAAGHEAERLRARVQLVEPAIIWYRELPDATAETFEVMFGRMRELTAALPGWVSVVDLSEAKRPDAAERAALRQQMSLLAPRLMHVSVVVPDANLAMRAMARLFAFMMGVPSASVHSTREEAMETARRVLRR